MFEAIRNNQRIAQVILAILIVPFAFFGMESYFRDAPGQGEVASVDGSKISVAEFEQALRDQQDRLRNVGRQVDRATLESLEFRRAVLDDLVNRRVLTIHAVKSNLVVSQQQIQEMIASVPEFQEDGRFSLARYEALVRAQGMTPAVFEARLSHDLRTQQIAQAAGQASFTATASVRRILAAQLEEREVREMSFSPARYVGEITLADNAARAYYDANPGNFQQPARLRAEYVVLDEAGLRDQVKVSDEDVRQFYDANQQRFSVQEERQARHILIQAAADAPDEEVARAKEKAEGLLATLRKDPSRFEALARAESQDPGSAARGGDLGLFGRGVMVKPFEDAAFALQKGEISEVVRSDFGFHIIQVTDIKPATVRPFAEVKDEIADELARRAAALRFAEVAEQFNNTVYEQPDSLQPAAELVKGEIRSTDWVSRDAGAVGPFRSEKLLAALFSDDAVTNRRNTEAIEVGNNILVAARVVEFEPARTLEFDAVKDGIEQQLRNEQAAKRAAERGQAVLAALDKGEAVEGTWSAVRKIQRGTPTLPQAAMKAVFGVPSAKLPAHVGVTAPDGGYVVYRVESVKHPEFGDDDARLKAVAGQYGRLMAEQDLLAYVAMLRKRYDVEINLAAITPREQQ